MADESMPHHLARLTVPITCTDASGETSNGTGFFFQFDTDGGPIPVIITNRHVVEGAVRAAFPVHCKDSNRSPYNLQLDAFPEKWIPHPDSEADLAAIPIGAHVNRMNNNGFSPLYTVLSPKQIPSSDTFASTTALEDIVMIGYPIGLSDDHNNMPLFRKGVTATHPGMDYQGRQEFVVDIACFPGSSGSPVCLYTPPLPISEGVGMKIENNGPRLSLLGVLWGGPVWDATGSIEAAALPTRAGLISITKTFINLGFVIRSERILDFEPLLDEFAKRITTRP